jgi:hypothetical protein
MIPHLRRHALLLHCSLRVPPLSLFLGRALRRLCSALIPTCQRSVMRRYDGPARAAKRARHGSCLAVPDGRGWVDA